MADAGSPRETVQHYWINNMFALCVSRRALKIKNLLERIYDFIFSVADAESPRETVHNYLINNMILLRVSRRA